MAIYKDRAERHWAIYGRWLDWFRRQDVRAIGIGALAASVAMALVEWSENSADNVLDLLTAIVVTRRG